MIGTSLGPYKIIEQLGAGGMGDVYLGEDTRLGRKVKARSISFRRSAKSSTAPITDPSSLSVWQRCKNSRGRRNG